MANEKGELRPKKIMATKKKREKERPKKRIPAEKKNKFKPKRKCAMATDGG